MERAWLRRSRPQAAARPAASRGDPARLAAGPQQGRPATPRPLARSRVLPTRPAHRQRGFGQDHSCGCISPSAAAASRRADRLRRGLHLRLELLLLGLVPCHQRSSPAMLRARLHGKELHVCRGVALPPRQRLLERSTLELKRIRTAPMFVKQTVYFMTDNRTVWYAEPMKCKSHR